MTGNELKNRGVCGEAGFAGFNITKGCAPLLKDITEIRITPADFEYDDTREFNDGYLKELQREGKLNILQRIDLMESQSTANQFAASSKGFESLAIEGIYKFRATFNHDVWFNKQMGSLEGEYHKRVELVDSRGTIFRTEGTDADKSRGFLTAHITRAMQTLLNGTTKQAQYLDIQFANKSEFDDEPVIIDSESLSKATREIEPVVEASVSFNAIPLATDTTIAVKVILDRGQKTHIAGLTTSGDFLVKINGVAEAAAVAAEAAEVYTITVPALSGADIVTVEINGVKEVIGDALYTSKAVSVTTLAP